MYDPAMSPARFIWLVLMAVAPLAGAWLCWRIFTDARNGAFNPLRGLVLGVLVIVGILWFAGALDQQTWMLRK